MTVQFHMTNILQKLGVDSRLKALGRLETLRRFPRLLPALLYGPPGLLMLLAASLALAGHPAAGTLATLANVGLLGLFVLILVASLVHDAANARLAVAAPSL